MRVIIEGVRYDTENATPIISSASPTAGALDAWAATLYRTPRGARYFLAGEGGPLTRFSPRGMGFAPGAGIHPLTRTEAHAFASAYAPPETVSEFFEGEK